MSKNWIAVASAEHVRLGQQAGFMQVCHGKAAPLRRIQPGDGVLYYSPTTTFKGKEKLQAFTAIGIAKDQEPYPIDLGEDFCPFRRDVKWLQGARCADRPTVGETRICGWETQLGRSVPPSAVSNQRLRSTNYRRCDEGEAA